MKRLFLLPLILIAGLFSARAQETYFTIDDMPDLVKCLPAPPDTTSLGFAHDVMRYMWGKTMRTDAARAAIAERDAIWDLDTLAANDLYARGWDYGESRVIVGAHWQSDVDASRPAASIGYALLQTSPAYRAQMDKARAEFATAPRIPTVASLAEDLWTYSQTHPDGFTLNISTWEEPREGIAVAYSATQDAHDKADLEYVVSHARAHGGYVGGWQDEQSGKYYFDSVRIFPADSLVQARQFGRENQQKAIYNLSTGKEIRLPVRRSR